MFSKEIRRLGGRKKTDRELDSDCSVWHRWWKRTRTTRQSAAESTRPDAESIAGRDALDQRLAVVGCRQLACVHCNDLVIVFEVAGERSSENYWRYWRYWRVYLLLSYGAVVVTVHFKSQSSPHRCVAMSLWLCPTPLHHRRMRRMRAVTSNTASNVSTASNPNNISLLERKSENRL